MCAEIRIAGACISLRKPVVLTSPLFVALSWPQSKSHLPTTTVSSPSCGAISGAKKPESHSTSMILPISGFCTYKSWTSDQSAKLGSLAGAANCSKPPLPTRRSEEHTSELQSRLHLVCRLLLEQ